jgi:hypothetical protein
LFDILFKTDREASTILKNMSETNEAIVNKIEKNDYRPAKVFFMSNFFVLSDVLLYILKENSVVRANFLIFDGNDFDDNERQEFYGDLEIVYKEYIRKMSIVNSDDFDKKFETVNLMDEEKEKIYEEIKYLRAIDLLIPYKQRKNRTLAEKRKTNKFKNILIKIFSLDKILIAATTSDAELLWKKNQNQYRILTFDGFNKERNGVMTFNKGINTK